MQTLGIIGFGQFGQLAARHLKSTFDIVATDVADKREIATAIGVQFGTVADAAQCQNVVFSVPVQALQASLAGVAPSLRRGALVLDVASVKVLPTQWMIDALPKTVDIMGTHPLFGPQSARAGLAGQPLVLCPVRGDRTSCLKDLMNGLGLRVFVKSAAEHDREMAFVQALTHLVGRTLLAMKVPETDLNTNSYQHLLELCDLIRFDTLELFAAIQQLNPYSEGVTQSFMETAAGILNDVKQLQNKPRQPV